MMGVSNLKVGYINKISYTIVIKVVLRMSDNLSNLLADYREAISGIMGTHLVRIILYGSYARGDHNQDSDMDIMILADLLPDDISNYTDQGNWQRYCKSS